MWCWWGGSGGLTVKIVEVEMEKLVLVRKEEWRDWEGGSGIDGE